MKTILNSCLLVWVLTYAMVVVGQQQTTDTNKAIAALQDEVQWINGMVASGAISQNAAAQRIKELTFKAGELALGAPNSVVPVSAPAANVPTASPSPNQAPKSPPQPPASAPPRQPGVNQKNLRPAVLTNDSFGDAGATDHELTDLTSGEPTPRAGADAGSMAQATAAPTPDFSISATTPLIGGKTAFSTVTVISLGGFTTAVNLTVTCPTGTTCTLSTSTVTPSVTGATSTLTIVTTGSTTVSGPVTVTGTSSGLSHTFQVTLNAPGCQNSYYYYSCGFTSWIGGVEWSGYSSQTMTTNGFLSFSGRTRYVWSHQKVSTNPAESPSAFGVALWLRVRLLSAPTPSANGVSFSSTLADPTGSITTTQLSNVGQAVDYVGGFELRLHQWNDTTVCTKENADSSTNKCNGKTDLGDPTSKSATRISLILGGGATTPLPANTVVDTFNAPPVNSPQCQAFANLYPPSSGVAGVYLNTNTTPTTCLMNPLDKTDPKNPAGRPINYVSFTNQDRTNFYPKYGAGFRLTRVFNASGPNSKPYAGSLDLTIGQDQSNSGGRWWGPVMRADGVWPIALGSSSLLYVFGSAAMRTANNKTYPPIILTTPASGSSPMVPGPDVTVLALQVPARDFYRIGLGLNLLDIFCKLKGANSCPAGSGANSAGTGPTTNPTPAKGNGS